MKQQKAKPKKILIDVYTDWCGWCKRMDRETYTDPKIIQYINENYYPVKFNAEQRAPVKFKDKTYSFMDQGGRGSHGFAVMLLNGQMGYPSTAFIDGELQVIGAVQGYQTVSGMNVLIHYISEEKYKSGKTLQQYEAEYAEKNKPSVPPTP